MMTSIPRIWLALGVYAVLLAVAAMALTGDVRLVVLIFIGGLAAKTWIHHLRLSQQPDPED